MADDLALFAAAYGSMDDKVGQTGKFTAGHECLTAADVAAALKAGGCNLIYGELLPAGLAKMCDPSHLDVARCAVVLELGMGTGKVAMQLFLQQPQVRRVLGVELARSRTEIGVAAMRALAGAAPARFALRAEGRGGGAAAEDDSDGATLAELRASGGAAEDGAEPRELLFRSGDMFELPCAELAAADAIIMQTCVPRPLYARLSRLLLLLRPGCRAVLFDDVTTIWDTGLALEAAAAAAAAAAAGPLPPPLPAAPPFRQMPVNVPESDTFSTSWSPEKGHHFYVYERVEDGGGGGSGNDSSSEGSSSEGGAAAAGGRPSSDDAAAPGSTGLTAPTAKFAAGAAVEVLFSWWPNETEELLLLDGTEQWFRGWVTGVALSAPDSEGEEEQGEGEDDEEEGGEEGAAAPIQDAAQPPVPPAAAAEATAPGGGDAAQPASKPAFEYTVLYDDGDVEERVPGWRMRVATSLPEVAATAPAGTRLVVTPPPDGSDAGSTAGSGERGD